MTMNSVRRTVFTTVLLGLLLVTLGAETPVYATDGPGVTTGGRVLVAPSESQVLLEVVARLIARLGLSLDV